LHGGRVTSLGLNVRHVTDWSDNVDSITTDRHSRTWVSDV